MVDFTVDVFAVVVVVVVVDVDEVVADACGSGIAFGNTFGRDRFDFGTDADFNDSH